ncbi:hypothetical protein TNCV_2086241 [Trichonephila clavipes]|nr:hypothetical protein TNCV_2086241 [Trichonephila clavipes]
MLPGSSTSLTALFHGCGKSFKTTGMCSRRHGGGRVRSTTPAEDRIYRPISKRNRRTTAQLGGKISFLLPQESRSPEKLFPDV